MTTEVDISTKVLPRVIEVIDREREKRAALSQLLDCDGLLSVLEEVYRDQDVTLTDPDRDAALYTALDEMLRLPEPKQGLGYVAAKSWVHRRSLAKRVGIPTVIAGAIAGGIAISADIAQQQEEQAVEEGIEQAYTTHRSLGQRLEQLRSSPLFASLPAAEAQEIAQLTQGLPTQLTGIASFFVHYAPEGSADELITDENFEQVADALPTIHQQLSTLEQSLQRGERYITQQQALDNLTVRIDQTYSTIQQLAQEPLARADAEVCYLQAQRNLEERQVQPAEQRLTELHQLEATLQQEYSLVIVGGVWRYFDNNSDRRNHYVLVQAQAPDGCRVEVAIPNEEENGRVYRVSEWGERVPQAVYDHVAADKQENGIIEDNLFGQKRRGYVTVDYAEGFQRRGGQITHWE